MLIKLAFRNVKRQFSSYAIYFITVMLTIAMIFSVNNIIQSDLMDSFLLNYFKGVKTILTGVTGFLALIMAFVLGYATSFLLKKRKKEFALYLIMGMNRKNIIAIFLFETALTFALALGAGILLGLLLYQALMGVFIAYVELEYTVTGYSFVALFYTIVTVCAVFALSSLASAGYLRFEKIARLLNGEKISEKTVRFPVLWVLVAALGLIGSGVFINMFIAWLKTPDFFETVYIAGILIALAAASVILGSMGLCKGITWLIVKCRSGRAKSVGMFTARQLSGSASANSVMVGLLAVLMSLVIIGPNIFFSMSSIYTRQTDEQYLYDVSAYALVYEGEEDVYGTVSKDEAEKLAEEYEAIIAKYAKIERSAVIFVYHTFDPQSSYGEDFVKRSEFEKLCALLGYTLPEEAGERFRCDAAYKATEPFEWEYGSLRCPGQILLHVSSGFTVVPDEELEDVAVSYGILAVDLADGWFDARALDAEVNPRDGSGNRSNYVWVKEYKRLDMLGQGGLFLLGDLYASVVFLLLTLAILSLKMLSMVSEDKQKYKILWKLGATRAQLFRSMLAQLLFFCCLPFFIPVCINVPLFSIISVMYDHYGFDVPVRQAALQLAGFTFAVLGVCALYLLAASIVSWLDIRRSLRENG